VESPLPETIVDELTGEKDVARIASPCPAIEAAHRETALTRNTACGVKKRETVSSVVLIPGWRSEW
jgi:hypothetical protein